MALKKTGLALAAPLLALGISAAPAVAQTSSHPSATTPSTVMPSTTPSRAGTDANSTGSGNMANGSTSTGSTSTGSTGSGNMATSSNSSTTGSSLMGDRIHEVRGGYLSSKLVGATVYNDQNESIGSIDNLVVDNGGKVNEAVISVGGFLGVGSKLVEIPFSQLQFRHDGDGTGRQVVLPNATKQSLKSMQEFSYSS